MVNSYKQATEECGIIDLESEPDPGMLLVLIALLYSVVQFRSYTYPCSVHSGATLLGAFSQTGQ